MAKTKISEYSTTNSSNSDIEGINLAEGCAPSGINNAIRELMVHLKEFQTGASSDPLTVAGAFVASSTATLSGGATLSGTNTLSGANIISGNINSSGTNTFSGTNVVSGTLSLSSALGVASGGTGTTTLTGVVVGNGTSAFTAKTNPTGAFVGTSDSQTLTNKTIALGSNTVSGTKAEFNTAVTDTDIAFTNDFTGTNQSLSSSGYQKLPGGLIMQWGSGTLTGNQTATITFPVAFATAGLSIVVSDSDTSSSVDAHTLKASIASTTQATIKNTNTETRPYHYIAIGY